MARFFAVEKREKGRASPFHILPAVAGTVNNDGTLTSVEYIEETNQVKVENPMLAYVFDRLTPDQIDGFEKMPVSLKIHYQGFQDFVICHGSPWKTNESMREDFGYIDELTKRLETELTICAHFHIQSKYTRNGKQVINPGAVGVPLRSNGQAQFMMLTGNHGKWETEFVTLPYDRESVIREMDEEKLSEQAPGWYRITKDVLRNGRATHLMTLMKAQELYEQDTGINDWKNIPEEYWNMALEEMKAPK